jgi:hypothetical protein
VTKTHIVTPKPANKANLPAELREIFDLLAAHGRKVRLAAEATDEQQKQANYKKMVAEVNEFLSRMDKEENPNDKSA